MKGVIAAAVLAAAIAVPAAAAAGAEGFRHSWRLQPKIELVAGVPSGGVYCATSDQAWEATGHSLKASAFTRFATGEVFFKRRYCRILENWTRGRKVRDVELGAATLSLVHEAVHVRGIVDEGETECRALRELPRWLWRAFGIKRPARHQAVMAWARRAHAVKSAAYRTVC